MVHITISLPHSNPFSIKYPLFFPPQRYKLKLARSIYLWHFTSASFCFRDVTFLGLEWSFPLYKACSSLAILYIIASSCWVWYTWAWISSTSASLSANYSSSWSSRTIWNSLSFFWSCDYDTCCLLYLISILFVACRIESNLAILILSFLQWLEVALVLLLASSIFLLRSLEFKIVLCNAYLSSMCWQASTPNLLSFWFISRKESDIYFDTLYIYQFFLSTPFSANINILTISF